MTLETSSKATIAVAVSSPWWLPSLHTASAWAGEWLPLAGLAVTVLHGIFWLLRIWRTYNAK